MAKMGELGQMLDFMWQGNQNQGSSLQQKWWVMSRRAHGQQRLPSGRLSRFCFLQCSLSYRTHVWSLLCFFLLFILFKAPREGPAFFFLRLFASLASDWALWSYCLCLLCLRQCFYSIYTSFQNLQLLPLQHQLPLQLPPQLQPQLQPHHQVVPSSTFWLYVISHIKHTK